MYRSPMVSGIAQFLMQDSFLGLQTLKAHNTPKQLQQWGTVHRLSLVPALQRMLPLELTDL